MKRTLIALAIALVAMPAMAQQQFPITKHRGQSGTATYIQGGHIIGHSRINPDTGTETYWPNQNYGYGYQGQYNRPSATGYQMGRDLGTIFRGLTGRR